MKPFSLLYFLLAAAFYLLALPLILLLAFKPKYRASIPARFFLWNNPPLRTKGVWFHVCSFGEARAIKPVLERLGETTPVGISTITHTGFEEARKYKAEVRYLPYELFLPLWVKPQRTLVVVEAELWYMLFAAASARGAKVILLNARLSERSFPKYRRFAWFYKRIFAYCDTIFVQSIEDKLRFEALGATRIEVTGNIKLAQKIEKSRELEKPEGESIVAASTHEGEEAAIIEAFCAYRKAHESRLIVVPRHPERFASVWKLMEAAANKHGLSLSRWSETRALHADLVLIDAMGELNNIYAISDIAVLGGAFREDVGGHNPLEPARFGCKIITGKHFFNQKELFKYVHHVQFCETTGIEAALEAAATIPPSRVDEVIDLEGIIREIGNR